MKVLSIENVPDSADVVITIKRLLHRVERFRGDGIVFTRDDGWRPNIRMERTFRELYYDI